MFNDVHDKLWEFKESYERGSFAEYYVKECAGRDYCDKINSTFCRR